MLDGIMRRLLDPGLNRVGRALAARRVSADRVTLIGLGLGLIAALLISLGVTGWTALLPLFASRVADGLDGAVARASQITDFGGYLDILCDFIFYGASPLAFVLQDPVTNGRAGAFLLTSFYVNGTSFLGYAVLAEKLGLQGRSRGVKSLFFTSGLLEGTETIGFFALICLWPQGFAELAWIFGALCYLTAGLRLLSAWRSFGRAGSRALAD